MKKLEQELDHLREKIIEMGNLAESMVSGSTSTLADSANDDTIRSVLTSEESLDQMQLDVDKEAIRLLTVYSPVARNLRLVLSVSKITAELERIGDHCVNICENVQLMVSKTDSNPVPEIHQMANVVQSMFSDSLNAFAQNDIRKAQLTITQDDLVDALNDRIVEEILSDEIVRKALQGPADIPSIMAQILIARSLERIADQSTNICEEVVYMVKGDDIRHQI